MKNNKKGFVLSLFLISLPLFVSCLMVFTSLLFCIRNHDLAQTICFKYNLQAQEKIRTSLQHLLSLNPIAKQLKEIEKHLRKLLRATKYPPAAAILRAKITLIRNQRVLLDRKQKYILNTTNKYMESSFLRFKKQMTEFRITNIQKDHYHPIPLAVKAKSKKVIAPTYHPVKSFSKHQKISFSWKMSLHRFLPTWIQKVFFKSQLSPYSCATTIKKNQLKWKTTLAFLPVIFSSILRNKKIEHV